jgi:hypothetical protein
VTALLDRTRTISGHVTRFLSDLRQCHCVVSTLRARL